MYAKFVVPAIAALSLAAQPTVAQELTGTLKKVKDSGSITIGHRESSVPFSYYDDKQQVIGYAMDLCNKIADAVKKELKLAKLEVKLNPVTSATRIPLMANGTVDLECGSTTNNLERQQQVALHHHPFRHRQPLRVEEGRQPQQVDDLKGKTITSTSGTTNIKQITEISAQKNLGLNILPAKDHAEAFLMVETDRAAAFVMDDILLYSLVAGSKIAGRLCDLQGRAVGRTLRHHAAPRRSGLQESRRCGNDPHLQERRNQRDLRQVVHQADPAQGHEPEPADERRSSRKWWLIRPPAAIRKTTNSR